ncbi:MAG: DUF4381 domain-containing protein [Candidatus Competibacterales bacterium]
MALPWRLGGPWPPALQGPDVPLDLRDIRLPTAPDWWPPAPGWWGIAALGCVLLGVLLAWGRRWWALQRRRRFVLDELERAWQAYQNDAEDDAPQRLAGALSTVLRRVALSRHPALEVAALRDEAWLDFLDRSGDGEQFRTGVGRWLLEAPYAPKGGSRGNNLTPADSRALYDLVRRWVLRNV